MKNAFQGLLLLFMVLALGSSAFSDEPEVATQVGQQAPDFTLPQLDGEPINLYETVAQYDVTLLYFFYAAT